MRRTLSSEVRVLLRKAGAMTSPTEKSPHQVPTTNPIGDQGLLPEFEVHPLNDDGARAAHLVRQTFSAAMLVVENLCPAASRSKSIVVTKLQEACFFAVRAVSETPRYRKDGDDK